MLVLIIMIQNPKGGGLSATFGGGSNQMLGVQKTTDFLDRGTWILAISLLTLTLLSNFAVENKTSIEKQTELQGIVDEGISQEFLVDPDIAKRQAIEEVPTNTNQNE